MKFFCSLPWINYSTRSNGYVRVCCNANQGPTNGILYKDDGSPYTYKDNINTTRNCKLLKEIRLKLLKKEWHPECIRCQKEYESKEGDSSLCTMDMKEGHFNFKDAVNQTNTDGSIDTDKVPIFHYDLRFGTKCNLRCRMCFATDSDSWYKDICEVYNSNSFMDLGEKIEIVKENGKYVAKNDPYGWYNEKIFWDNIKVHIHELKSIYIVGGEPMLISQHFDYLKYCIESNNAHNIGLSYNTNATVIPDDAFDIWEHFKNVHFGVSVDGFERLNEYIRYPSKWKVVDRNIKKIISKKRYSLTIATTISIFNILDFPNLVRWAATINNKKFLIKPHLLHGPSIYNIRMFPVESKRTIENKLLNEIEMLKKEGYPQNIIDKTNGYIKSYINFMNGGDQSEHIPNFWSINKRMDENRNQMIDNYIPEVSKLLKAEMTQGNEYKRMLPSIEGLCLDIELGNVCNYNCSYCHPVTHSGSTWLPYENLIRFIEKSKASGVILCGGEPSLYPDITKLLIYLKSKKIHVVFITNGSRSLDWWKKHCEFIDYLVISYHLEYASLSSIKEKVKYLSNHLDMGMSISMIQDRFDECLQISDEFKNIGSNVILKALKNNKTKMLYDYTQEQLDKMKPEDSLQDLDPFVEYENNVIEKVAPVRMVTEGKNVFTGWKCWKGIDVMKILPDGNVYASACDVRSSKVLCNINDDNLNFPTKPCICDKSVCFCLTDIRRIRKEK